MKLDHLSYWILSRSETVWICVCFLFSLGLHTLYAIVRAYSEMCLSYHLVPLLQTLSYFNLALDSSFSLSFLVHIFPCSSWGYQGCERPLKRARVWMIKRRDWSQVAHSVCYVSSLNLYRLLARRSMQMFCELNVLRSHKLSSQVFPYLSARMLQAFNACNTFCAFSFFTGRLQQVTQWSHQRCSQETVIKWIKTFSYSSSIHPRLGDNRPHENPV